MPPPPVLFLQLFILKDFKSNVLEVFIPEGLRGHFSEAQIPNGLRTDFFILVLEGELRGIHTPPVTLHASLDSFARTVLRLQLP